MTLKSQEASYRKEALEQFLQLCYKKTYPTKATVIRPGDSGDRLYFIIDGSVSVCAEDSICPAAATTVFTRDLSSLL